jgi:hypothetical protein
MLRRADDWDTLLRQESRLPGPRANLELAHAVADIGDAALLWRMASLDAMQAPTNTPDEFLACCGVLGLGRLLVQGDAHALHALRRHAGDPRWRIREMVATALQRLGRHDMVALLAIAEDWATDGPLEQRAAAAALCEPDLLAEPADVQRVLAVLDTITASIRASTTRKGEAFRVLRQGMAYCWSVAVAALPDEGKAYMERWLGDDDRDVRWIMKSNLGKARLTRMDATWVARCLEQLGARV